MSKLGVLVPAYNSEGHLRQCLDSILAQTTAGAEIFICNDGSTDGTERMLAEYSRAYPQVHYITQENKGVSKALNALLDALPEEIEEFAIVDADDYIHPEMLRLLHEAMAETGAQVAECQIKHVRNEARPPEGLDLAMTGERLIIDDLSVYLLKRTAPSKGWINKNNKLYLRKAVGNLRFREGLAFEEDYFYGCEVNATISKKVIIPYALYAYRDNPKSVTHVLNQRRYFDSTTRRIRLTLTEFLTPKRIPAALEEEYRKELTKDAYRMCIRKNLKRNRDGEERKELFRKAGEFIREIEREFGFKAIGLNPIQQMIWASCKRGNYLPARLLAYLT